MTMTDRLWAKVEAVSSGCWLWTGATTGRVRPYGQLWVDGGNRLAHRLVYELLIGPIPAGLQPDHLCRTPSCVNPTHLEPVTGSTNLRRSPLVGKANTLKTHCPAGHVYDSTNTYVDKRGKRYCRACSNARRNLYRRPVLEAGT